MSRWEPKRLKNWSNLCLIELTLRKAKQIFSRYLARHFINLFIGSLSFAFSYHWLFRKFTKFFVNKVLPPLFKCNFLGERFLSWMFSCFIKPILCWHEIVSNFSFNSFTLFVIFFWSFLVTTLEITICVSDDFFFIVDIILSIFSSIYVICDVVRSSM